MVCCPHLHIICQSLWPNRTSVLTPLLCLMCKDFKEGKTACCGWGPYRGLLSCGGKRTIKEYELCSNVSKCLLSFSSFYWQGQPAKGQVNVEWNSQHYRILQFERTIWLNYVSALFWHSYVPLIFKYLINVLDVFFLLNESFVEGHWVGSFFQLLFTFLFLSFLIMIKTPARSLANIKLLRKSNNHACCIRKQIKI